MLSANPANKECMLARHGPSSNPPSPTSSSFPFLQVLLSVILEACKAHQHSFLCCGLYPNNVLLALVFRLENVSELQLSVDCLLFACNLGGSLLCWEAVFNKALLSQHHGYAIVALIVLADILCRNIECAFFLNSEPHIHNVKWLHEQSQKLRGGVTKPTFCLNVKSLLLGQRQYWTSHGQEHTKTDPPPPNRIMTITPLWTYLQSCLLIPESTAVKSTGHQEVAKCFIESLLRRGTHEILPVLALYAAIAGISSNCISSMADQ